MFCSQALLQGSQIVFASILNLNEATDSKETHIDGERENGYDHEKEVKDNDVVSSNTYLRLLLTHQSVADARKDYLDIHMDAREDDFTFLSPFKVFIGTWNVNGQVPGESLAPWLQPPREPLLRVMPNTREPPDIYVIGFQELDLSVETFLFNESGREEQWLSYIESALPVGCYFQISVVRLVGIMMAVYVHEKHKMHVTNVASETYGTGIMGIVGNKGGVSTRFQFHRSTLCFVNSHLAAHMEEVGRRNKDFNDIYNNLTFKTFRPPLNISPHDVVFWLGDLNYRFDELIVDEIKYLSDTRDYETLYKYDQLNKQRKLGNTLCEFIESQPNFSPTYKYNPGTNEWDTSSKLRPPAWCDRILWKRESEVDQLSYECHADMKLSDHKPVSSLFDVQIKMVDPTREEKVFEEVLRKLDKEENWSVPKVNLDKEEISFGRVEFMGSKSVLLKMENVGRGMVEFAFVPKSSEKQVCKPWLQITPLKGFIEVEGSTEITITLCVEKHSALLATKSKFRLDDVLVLHLIHGKDIFIPLNAEYAPSVFGASLETLVRMHGPITSVPSEHLIPFENVAPHSAAFLYFVEPLEIPKELWVLVDHIYKFGMTTENIILQVGIYEEIIQIRKYLDTYRQKRNVPGNIYSIGNALILFLETLYEPVIPHRYHSKCLNACHNESLCKQVINNLPKSHYNVFRYICAFLREVLKHREENKHDAGTLAKTFAPIFLRKQYDDVGIARRWRILLETQRKEKFVSHFLADNFRW